MSASPVQLERSPSTQRLSHRVAHSLLLHRRCQMRRRRSLEQLALRSVHDFSVHWVTIAGAIPIYGAGACVGIFERDSRVNCAGYSGAGRGGRIGSRTRSSFVSTTIRLYFDALIAVALMIVVAIVCGFIASAIIGDNPPNLPVAGIAFVVTGLVLLLRLWRSLRQPALPSS